MQYTNESDFVISYASAYSPRMTSAKTIAARLDEAMQEQGPKGITQKKLSVISGVPQPTICRTLKGLTDPEIDTLRKLAAALNLTFEWLNEGVLPKYKTERRQEDRHEEVAASPADYAEVVRLFGEAPQHTKEEVLRLLSHATGTRVPRQRRASDGRTSFESKKAFDIDNREAEKKRRG